MFTFKRPFVIGDSTWQKWCGEDSCKRTLDPSEPLDPSDPWYLITCYRQMSMAAFEKINASWITYNTLCDPMKWSYKLSDEEHQQKDNLQEANMKITSFAGCPYGM